jgi:hypothetical protein
LNPHAPAAAAVKVACVVEQHTVKQLLKTIPKGESPGEKSVFPATGTVQLDEPRGTVPVVGIAV